MRTIGPYEICGLLGRGGMSLVYKVRLPVVEKIMALKLFHPRPLLIDLLGEETLKRLFVAEAKIMAQLSHPHLLEVRDFNQTSETPYLVMEYYCNNLGALIGESGELEKPTRRLKPDRVFHYGRQILLGVDRLHRAGIIHRDLKPANFLITDEDQIKIADFGLSLLRGETLSAPENLKVGSPYYAAPEQEQDPDRVDSRADLYSIGITLVRLATGSLPLDNRRQPRRTDPDSDPEWDAFFLKGTARDKQDRFASAEEMLRALEGLRRHWETSQPSVCPDSAPTAERTGKKRPLLFLRARPLKTPLREARSLFKVDRLWRPRRFSSLNLRETGDGTVLDDTHGLRWEQNGSEYPLTWPEAGEYVRGLNRARFAGRSEWRLPTVDELLSLITESPQSHSYCLAPPFDPGKKCLWSADRRSFTAAWFVSIDLGFVFWQDFTCHYYVRSVCSF